MQGHFGPDLDIDAARAQLKAAIAHHEEAAEALRQQRVEVRPADFGAGFAAQGARIAQQLDRLHGTSQRFLATRVRTWESIAQLVDDVERRDSDTSAALGKAERA